MKKYLVLIFMILSAFNLISDDLIINVDKKELYKDVQFFTSLPGSRNHKNLTSLNLAADYIKNKFINSGLEAEEEVYTVNNKKYKNIIAKINSNYKNKIIIGAHYDVYGDQDGADDNASGVAGLLELAGILKANEKLIKNQIVLIAFTLEEPPYFNTEYMGSYINSKKSYEKKEKINYMISLEMIGYFDDKSNSQNYPLKLLKKIYPDKGDFIAVVGMLKEKKILKGIKNIYKKKTKIECQVLAAPAIIPGIDLSDHKNYWKFGYKAIMITDTSFNRNLNYHKQSDKIETLNFEKMAEVIKGLSYFIIAEK